MWFVFSVHTPKMQLPIFIVSIFFVLTSTHFSKPHAYTVTHIQTNRLCVQGTTLSQPVMYKNTKIKNAVCKFLSHTQNYTSIPFYESN